MAKDRDSDPVYTAVAKALCDIGVDYEDLRRDRSKRPKVVVMAADLCGSDLSANSQRDQVVMARVDSETVKALDIWVAAGVAKSRSEAAAFFIREGLRLRADKLSQLEKAHAKYEKAKAELQEQTRRVLGEEDDSA